MQLRYIRPFSQYKTGDVVEFPDGAAFDPFYLEPVPAPPAPAVRAPAVPTAPKEM